MREETYWEGWYRQGGASGPGSVGALRGWKWSILEKYSRMNDVVDVGCGDLSFWGTKECKRYIGIDISPSIIEQNRIKCPQWTFICSPAGARQDVSAETVICLDMLFHIMDDKEYIKILQNLTYYSQKFIFIYTWHKNPLATSRNHRLYRALLLLKSGRPDFYKAFSTTTDGVYQKYRDFSLYTDLIEENGFRLLNIESPVGIDTAGAMYVLANGKL